MAAWGAAVFLRETGARFRDVGWACFALLLVTGTFNLWARGIGWAELARADFRATAAGHAVLTKLGVFLLVLVVSALHDFVLGPRATQAIARDAASPEARRLRRGASWLGRLNVLLALVLVAAGVVLVRGWPP